MIASLVALLILMGGLCGWLARRLSRARLEWMRSVNDMRSNVELQLLELQNEQQRLQTIVRCMGEGVLVTSDRAVIQLMNPAMKQMLGVTVDGVGETVLECCRHVAIHEAIARVLRTAVPEMQEVSVATGAEPRQLLMHAAPLGSLTQRVGVVTVFHDVTALRRLEEMRKEFVANVSHEFKTPLTNIRGYAETLRQGALSDPAAAPRFIEKIEHQGGYLL